MKYEYNNSLKLLTIFPFLFVEQNYKNIILFLYNLQGTI